MAPCEERGWELNESVVVIRGMKAGTIRFRVRNSKSCLANFTTRHDHQYNNNIMQFQKIMLFVALGLTLVMIWQSWVEFQQQYHPANGQQATQNAGNAESGTTGSTNLSEDVPDAPEVTSAQVSSTEGVEPVVEEVSSSGQIVNITTDMFNVQIDTQGGDIIHVELLKHPVSVDTPDQPFVLMHRDSTGLFVAQNGLIGKGRDYPNHNVLFSASQLDYQLGDEEYINVVLKWAAPDRVEYEKIFRFERDSYRIDIDFQVSNNSDQPWEGFVYGQLKQTEIVQPGSMGFLGRLPSYNGAAIYTEEEKYEKIDYGEIREEVLDRTTPDGWVSMLQHYFVSAWLPSGSDSYQLYSGVSDNNAKPQYRIGYKTTQPVLIPAGETGVINTALFVGPKEQVRLDEQGVTGLKLTVDYGWLTPVANPLFWLLNKIYGMTQNWGWAIILLTVLVKAIFYPLSAASYKSMAKMKKLQPRMATLKERYSDDKAKFQQEMMKLYKAEKVNPAGGCLPVLVQIPVFISLYWVLLESVELRQADFMWWLNDLSLPDPYFVLPIIMGASMIAQHFLNPAPVDPIQKKIMMALPFVFTIFFLWFPAGLVLYWVVNNLLSIAQQYYITRKYQST
jgi:YidC/Oxa1 family membrane protein insertase